MDFIISEKFGKFSAIVAILSCMASEFDIYLVANIGRHVWRRGQLKLFNSDLAFDR